MAGINTEQWIDHLIDKQQALLALPSFGAGYLPPNEISNIIRKYREKTRYFNMNLFILDDKSSDMKQLQDLHKYLNSHYKHFNLEQPPLPRIDMREIFSKQFDCVLQSRAPIMSFTFGRLSQKKLNS